MAKAMSSAHRRAAAREPSAGGAGTRHGWRRLAWIWSAGAEGGSDAAQPISIKAVASVEVRSSSDRTVSLPGHDLAHDLDPHALGLMA